MLVNPATSCEGLDTNHKAILQLRNAQTIKQDLRTTNYFENEKDAMQNTIRSNNAISYDQDSTMCGSKTLNLIDVKVVTIALSQSAHLRVRYYCAVL